MGRKMPDLLGEIGAVGVLFQRLVDQRRDHEAECHVDEHIACLLYTSLAVLQQDVVLRHVTLDERALEHQRLKFRRRNDDVKMVDMRHHLLCLRRVGGRILKIPVSYTHLDVYKRQALLRAFPGRPRPPPPSSRPAPAPAAASGAFHRIFRS